MTLMQKCMFFVAFILGLVCMLRLFVRLWRWHCENKWIGPPLAPHGAKYLPHLKGPAWLEVLGFAISYIILLSLFKFT